MSEASGQLDKPLMVYDGDCGFCRRSVVRWRKITGDAIAYAPSQEVAGRYPQVPAEQFARSVVLIEPGGRISVGAEAVFRSLAAVPGRRGWGWWAYRRVPGFAAASESAYRFVAAHRMFMSRMTQFLRGRRR
jgi:predicted DCC family thiol-disulfide oxidoreductase YuxK